MKAVKERLRQKFLGLGASVQHLMVYSIGNFLVKGIGFFMLPYVTSQLSVADYGRWEYISQIIMVVGFLFYTPWCNSCIRFASPEKKETDQMTWFSSSILAMLVLSMFLIPFLFWLFQHLFMTAFTKDQILFTLLIVLFSSLYRYYTLWFQLRDRSIVFVFASVLYVLLMVAICVVLLRSGFGLWAMLWGGLVPPCILALVGILYDRSILSQRPRFKQIKRLAIMGASLIPESVAAFIFQGLEVMLLIQFVGFLAGAQYAIAQKFAGIFLVLIIGVDTWWRVKRFELFEHKTLEQHRSIALTLGVGLFLFAQGIGLVSPFVIQWLLPEDYHVAGMWVFVLVNVYAIRTLIGFISTGYYKREHMGHATWFNVLVSVGAIVAYYFFIPEYKVLACLWIVGIGFLLQSVVQLMISQQQIHQKIPYAVLSVLIGMAGIAHVLIQHCTSWVVAMLMVALAMMLMTAWSFGTNLLSPIRYIKS